MLVWPRGILDLKGVAGLDEFRAAGKESGDLVITGWRPAPAFAADTISSIIANMGCFSVPGFRGVFHLGCGVKGLEVCRKRGNGFECI